MRIFDRLATDGHEQVVHCSDPATGLRAIVAVHSTRLGPSLGGTRFRAYGDEDEALDDVLRLSRAMTYKAAVAGLPQGGGKAVILGDPRRIRTDALIRSYGRFVDTLGGRYVTAEDVGTTQTDMDIIREETRFVTGASEALGGSGDPSPPTAAGVHAAMRAALDHLGSTLEGATVVVLGVGKVGGALLAHLRGDGARLVVADIDDDAVARAKDQFGAEVVPVEDAHRVDCDVFSPCALGGILNERTIAELRCRAVVGCANNQLATPEDAVRAADAGVLYVPDFVANAGGIINIAGELSAGGYDRTAATAAVGRIFDTTLTVLRAAAADGVTPVEAAERIAERRLGGSPSLSRPTQIRTFQEIR